MKIFIGASSSEKIPEKYLDDCTKLLEIVLKENDLVFGAYDKGLMGLSYQIAKKNHRAITGIYPNLFKDNASFLTCDEEKTTTSIIDSTMKIYQHSDAMIMLPGGFGCLYEFFTANYCKICHEIDIPIILYNSCGYYDKLLDFMSNIQNANFIKPKEIGNFFVASNPNEVITYLDSLKKK